MINEASRKWWVLTGVSIVSFLGCIDLTIVNTAAPDIGRDLRATVTQMQLVVNIFIVALSMFMVTAGRLSDMFGRRKTGRDAVLTGTSVVAMVTIFVLGRFRRAQAVSAPDPEQPADLPAT